MAHWGNPCVHCCTHSYVPATHPHYSGGARLLTSGLGWGPHPFDVVCIALHGHDQRPRLCVLCAKLRMGMRNPTCKSNTCTHVRTQVVHG